MNQTRFRPEVLAGRIHQSLGPALIDLPLSVERLGWGVVFGVAGLMLYVLCVPYAESVMVSGYLDLNPGVVRVYPRRAGLVVQQRVRVGQRVQKGQVILVIKTGFDQMEQEQQQAVRRFSNLEHVLQQTVHQKYVTFQHAKQLFQAHYVSRREVDQDKQAWYSAKAQLAELIMRRMQVRMATQYDLVAPIEGVISEVASDIGQWVEPHRLVVKLLPEGAEWMVRLLVPVQQIRFVSDKQAVRVRYDAYPARRFGTDPGRVETINTSFSTAKELLLPLKISEPFYQVSVSLLKPVLGADQRLKQFYQGMTCHAQLQVPKQALWHRLFKRDRL